MQLKHHSKVIFRIILKSKLANIVLTSNVKIHGLFESCSLGNIIRLVHTAAMMISCLWYR